MMDTLITAVRQWPAAALCVGLGAMYTAYYFTSVVKKPMLACGDAKFHRFLRNHVPILSQYYWPTFWCFETNLQTIVYFLFQFIVRGLKYRSERLTTPDGGEIVIDWLDGEVKGDDDKRPTVVILPGLTGDSNSIYVKHLVDDVKEGGYRAVVFNQRGFGGAELKTPRTFCAGSTDDIHFVLNHIHQSYPAAPLMAIGSSIGGIMLLNYLAEYGDNCVPLEGVMTVSVAWDLVESCKSLEQPLNSLLYNRTLTLNLIHLVKTKGLPFREHFDMSTVCKSRTLREFDSNLTVKVFGYRDVHHYYSSSSPKGKLSQITVPTLCLNAADDPFAPLHTIPLDEARHSKNVSIVVTSHGGHVGFMEGFLPHGGKTYMNRLFAEFLTAIFTQGNHNFARD